MELCFNVRTFLALFEHQHDHHSEYAMVYSDEIEDKIDQIMLELKHCYPNLINYRWHALKLLEEIPQCKAAGHQQKHQQKRF